MLKLLKYIPAAMAGRNVIEEVKRIKGEQADKPFYLRQRFWGMTGIAGTITASAVLGYQVDKIAVNQLVDSLNQLSIAIAQIVVIIKNNGVPAAIVGWSAIVALKGQYDANMRAKAGKQVKQ